MKGLLGKRISETFSTQQFKQDLFLVIVSFYPIPQIPESTCSREPLT